MKCDWASSCQQNSNGRISLGQQIQWREIFDTRACRSTQRKISGRETSAAVLNICRTSSWYSQIFQYLEDSYTLVLRNEGSSLVSDYEILRYDHLAGWTLIWCQVKYKFVSFVWSFPFKIHLMAFFRLRSIIHPCVLRRTLISLLSYLQFNSHCSI